MKQGRTAAMVATAASIGAVGFLLGRTSTGIRRGRRSERAAIEFEKLRGDFQNDTDEEESPPTTQDWNKLLLPNREGILLPAGWFGQDPEEVRLTDFPLSREDDNILISRTPWPGPQLVVPPDCQPMVQRVEELQGIREGINQQIQEAGSDAQDLHLEYKEVGDQLSEEERRLAECLQQNPPQKVSVLPSEKELIIRFRVKTEWTKLFEVRTGPYGGNEGHDRWGDVIASFEVSGPGPTESVILDANSINDISLTLRQTSYVRLLCKAI